MLNEAKKDSVSVDLSNQIARSERIPSSDISNMPVGHNIVMSSYLKTERKEKREIESLNTLVAELRRTIQAQEIEKGTDGQGDKLFAAWEEIKVLKLKLFKEEGEKLRAEQYAQQVERNQETLRSSLRKFLGTDE